MQVEESSCVHVKCIMIVAPTLGISTSVKYYCKEKEHQNDVAPGYKFYKKIINHKTCPVCLDIVEITGDPKINFIKNKEIWKGVRGVVYVFDKNRESTCDEILKQDELVLINVKILKAIRYAISENDPRVNKKVDKSEWAMRHRFAYLETDLSNQSDDIFQKIGISLIGVIENPAATGHKTFSKKWFLLVFIIFLYVSYKVYIFSSKVQHRSTRHL